VQASPPRPQGAREPITSTAPRSPSPFPAPPARSSARSAKCARPDRGGNRDQRDQRLGTPLAPSARGRPAHRPSGRRSHLATRRYPFRPATRVTPAARLSLSPPRKTDARGLTRAFPRPTGDDDRLWARPRARDQVSRCLPESHRRRACTRVERSLELSNNRSPQRRQRRTTTPSARLPGRGIRCLTMLAREPETSRLHTG
jgi:hypothetical protein